MNKNENTLFSGRHLTRNALWNLLGTAAPLLVAIVVIPVLIKGLGLSRFGVLTITWMIIGYFSLFDLGLGRALTKLVAEKLGKGQDRQIPKLIWTALILMVLLGTIGALIIAAISQPLISKVLNIPAELQSETLHAFYLLAIAVPIVISSTGLQGVLEAHQCFSSINFVRIPLGIFTFLGPVLVLPFTNNLASIVTVLIIGRLLSWVAYLVLCSRLLPDLRHSITIDRGMFKLLISFGGWMTVSNIISPIMVYLDRFLIGAVLTMTAVSYYATPYEVVTRLLIIPGALMGVMFPAFATVLAQNASRASFIYSATIKYIFLLLFPAVLLIVTFSSEALNFWLGSDFADNSTLVLQILAIGVFLNAHANVPFGLVQSAGRPDLTAKLHLVELPFYLVILWWLLNSYGIAGVALAWLMRVVVDTVFLFVMANSKVIKEPNLNVKIFIMAVMALICLVIGAKISDLTIKWIYLCSILTLFALIVWSYLLSAPEKEEMRNLLRNG